MKRLTLILLLASVVSWSQVVAQNNPYGIDDECYQYFVQAEKAVDDLGSQDFDATVDALLNTAIQKGDAKAQTLYYVCKLKRVSREGQAAPPGKRAEYNAKVRSSRETLQQVANRTGYPQYYYYAFELAQTYYYNTGQETVAFKLLDDAMAEARKAGDEYGLWQCLRYISQIYTRRSDALNARRYLRESIDLYESSTNPLVKRQSIARQCFDLADTYSPASDSARMYIQLGEKHSTLTGDTLRLCYYKAQLAAWDGDREAFVRNRDMCLADRSFPYQFRSGVEFLQCVESIMDGKPFNSYKSQIDALYFEQQMNFVAYFASERHQWEPACFAFANLVERMRKDMESVNAQRLGELSALYGNNALQEDLARTSRKVNRVTWLVAVLLTIILLGIIAVTLMRIRILRKARIKDEQMIAELTEANRKARAADEAKTRFVQNMSHEVRTPLNAIVGFSQLLSLPDGTFPPEEKDEFSHHIVNNTKMLTMLLDDILNTSQVDSGEYSICIEDGECDSICREAISSAEHRLQPGVTMTYEPEFDGGFTFRTDPRRVQQVLINLLTNACKHTAEGSIRLACSLTETPDAVTFSVTDTGTGVPAEDAEKIFQRFTKLDEFVQGTGLGLSICRDIVTRLGGKVFLDTTYDKGGARFLLVLPLNPDKPIS